MTDTEINEEIYGGIYLSPIRPEDGPMVASLIGDENLEYLKYKPERSDEKSVKEWAFGIQLDNCNRQQNDIIFLVFRRDILLGYIALHNIANGAFELSYFIGKEHRCKGNCYYAIAKALDVAFGVLKMDLCYAYVDENNIPSTKVLEKHKFAKIGYSLINSNVVRYEMTKTGRKNQMK